MTSIVTGGANIVVHISWMSYQLLKGIKNKKALKSEEKVILQELTDNYFRQIRSL